MFSARLGTFFFLFAVFVASGMTIPVMDVKSVDHPKDDISHFENAKSNGPDFGLDHVGDGPQTLEETIEKIITESIKRVPIVPKKRRENRVSDFRKLRGQRKKPDRNKQMRKRGGIFYKWKDP